MNPKTPKFKFNRKVVGEVVTVEQLLRQQKDKLAYFEGFMKYNPTSRWYKNKIKSQKLLIKIIEDFLLD